MANVRAAVNDMPDAAKRLQRDIFLISPYVRAPYTCVKKKRERKKIETSIVATTFYFT